jgi:hypothetical protein
VVRETDLFSAVAEMGHLGEQLEGLDLGDSKMLGSEVRRKITDHLGHVENLLRLCRDIAAFQPEPPADELRELTIASGKYGAEMLDAFTRTLSAENFTEAQKAAEEVKRLVARFPQGDAIHDALAKLRPWSTPDLDARLALALGRSGPFIDEDGVLDPARAMMAFASENSPYEAMSRQARSYFGHLIGTSGEVSGSEAVLLGPMVLLAAAALPLHAHRTSQLMFTYLSEAWGRNPTDVKYLIERTTEQGPVIYAALAQLQRGTQILSRDPSDEAALDQTLSGYRKLTETAFRTVGWLAVGIERINTGQAISSADHPPMLGELEQRLQSGGPLGKLLAGSVDTALRNAEAHVQYRWVPEREAVLDIRTHQEWAVSEVEDAIDLLVSCLAGADAGYACFVVGADVMHAAPEWLTDGVTPEAPLALASMCFSPNGYEVVEVNDNGATVVVKEPDIIDPARLLPSLAGMAAFVRSAEVFRVVTPDGKVLVEVEESTMRSAVEASPSLKGLGVMATVFESCIRSGMEPTQASRDFAALMAAVVAKGGLQDLVRRELAPAAFRDLIDQLRYLATFANKRFVGEDVQSFRHRISKLRMSAVNASRGDFRALESMTDQLGALASWADSQGIHWPPQAEGV